MTYLRFLAITSLQVVTLSSLAVGNGHAAGFPSAVIQVFEASCFDCHDQDMKKGGLDLTSLKYDPTDIENFKRWILIHDRVAAGEMPPKKKS